MTFRLVPEACRMGTDKGALKTIRNKLSCAKRRSSDKDFALWSLQEAVEQQVFMRIDAADSKWGDPFLCDILPDPHQPPPDTLYNNNNNNAIQQEQL